MYKKLNSIFLFLFLNTVNTEAGLLKKVQILGAREGTTESYLSSTLKEGRRGERRRWTFFNSPEASEPKLPQKYLPLPIVRQETNYSCGAASLLSILSYWGVFSGEESELYEPLHTTPENGTEPGKIVEVAASFGLQAESKKFTQLHELRRALHKGITVILDIQAWRDASNITPWKDDWDNGHYVVLIAMDKTAAYFMDPSAGPAYAYMPIQELLERWHDIEDQNGTVEKYYQLAIFIHGKNRSHKHSRTLIRIE